MAGLHSRTFQFVLTSLITNIQHPWVRSWRAAFSPRIATIGIRMKKSDIAEQLARETGVTQSEAADQVDEVVSSILRKLKKGGSANLPGVGRLRRDVKGILQFTQTPTRRPNGTR